ncbi:MAG: hypothetical protein GY765_27780 [bacterium]|nr:hypothetical protein [bacterium]
MNSKKTKKKIQANGAPAAVGPAIAEATKEQTVSHTVGTVSHTAGAPKAAGGNQTGGEVPDDGVTPPEPTEPPTDPGTGNETPASKSKRKTQAFDNRYLECYVVMDTAKNDQEFATRMLVFGYTPEMVAAGDSWLIDTKAAHERRDMIRVEKKALTKQIKLKMEEFDDAAEDTMSFCRTLFKKDETMLDRLLLNKTRERSFAGWLTRHEKMYKRILESAEVTAALALLGVTLERLLAEQQMVAGAAALHARRKQLESDAQDATQERNKSFKGLLRWVADYRDVAKVAFRDNEQMLERLGIVRRSPSL